MTAPTTKQCAAGARPSPGAATSAKPAVEYFFTFAFHTLLWPGTATLRVIFFLALAFNLQAADPLVDSWQTYGGAKYARIYKSQTDALAGSSVTTWLTGGRIVSGSQPTPVYAGIASVRVSTNYVYVQSCALPTYVMGPWYLDATKTNLFPNWPTNQNKLYRFPRVPVVSGNPKTKTSLGAIAAWVDGGIIHNQLDAFYWNGTADANAGSVFNQSWQRNANFAEGPTFDPSGSHQPYTGERHHHISPAALRYQLGDHMNYNPATHTYTENPAGTNHSPIVGWAFDGYPIYGPYGYGTATNPASAVRRMVSGYVPRDGSFGTTNLNVTGRTSYPQWALDIGKPNSVNGPNVNTNQPLGWYVQDFDHLADRGYTLGVDFDLDRYNGRFCKTPEFPGGTYAYFLTIDAAGTPVFPYIIGLQYNGVRTGGDYGAPATLNFTSVETPNTTNFLGGASAALTVNAPAVRNSVVTLTWNALEGGTYRVETTTNFTAWATNASGIVAAASTATNTTAAGARQFFRVVQTGLAAYDAVVTP